MGLSRVEIKAAVACPKWQEFREHLKNVSVERRIFWLDEYVKPKDWRQNRDTNLIVQKIVAHKNEECCDMHRRSVQALNYLNSLARAGLISPIPQGSQFADGVLELLRSKTIQTIRRVK